MNATLVCMSFAFMFMSYSFSELANETGCLSIRFHSDLNLGVHGMHASYKIRKRCVCVTRVSHCILLICRWQGVCKTSPKADALHAGCATSRFRTKQQTQASAFHAETHEARAHPGRQQLLGGSDFSATDTASRLQTRTPKQFWTAEEDKSLLTVVNQISPRQQQQPANAQMPHRADVQLRVHFSAACAGISKRRARAHSTRRQLPSASLPRTWQATEPVDTRLLGHCADQAVKFTPMKCVRA
ncbi:hypothetical protein FVE85_8884 [Porphyridium purpureum]|uniref:Myb-like domain-containing protein n=1 Tax=Porphyridium purpureum TaxID=35688 RepID=A0A5J4YPR6_PORPP|nr:hypothetical protein FVE85_8884 [Porphyridium purpureum]|eukprot:POR0148..scf296_7